MSADYTITDLASEFSVTTRTLRFYEEKGLLTPKRNGQTRYYTTADRARLTLILRGKRLGLSLQESSEIIAMYNPSSSNAAQLIALIKKVQAKRTKLLQQREELDQMIDEMDTWIERYKHELTGQQEDKKGEQIA